MNIWEFKNIETILSGRWLHAPQVGYIEPGRNGASIDSREVRKGMVFFARRGGKDDGHRYLHSAAKGGAELLIVEDEAAARSANTGHVPVLIVDNSTVAMGKLAAAHRDTLRGQVIAVTGSVGKTTTKYLIDAALSGVYRGTVSPKNFNNQTGAPISLLKASQADRYIVIELGTSHPGDIAYLAKFVRPDVAVITHIGSAHLEGLGDYDGVLREKASLLSYLQEGGLAIVNGDCPGLQDYRRVAPNMLTYGRGETCDLRLTDCRGDAEGVTFIVNDRFTYHIPLLGEHNALNALAAIAVGRHMNLSEQQIADGLSGVKGAELRLRSERIEAGDAEIVVLNDCYNANPDSVRAGLRVLRHFPTAGRRVAVLGDMAEMGDAGPDLHRQIGETVVQEGLDVAVFVGPLSMFAAESASRHWPADRVHAVPKWTDDTPSRIAAWLQPGDTVLVKASRSMGFERILPGIVDRFRSTVPGS